MATSALDPLRIPADLWDRDDVCRALDRRDIGALFRLLRRYAGASQHRIGTATELQQGTVCKVMNGERTVTSIDVLERIADGLHMPDHARRRLGLAPKEESMKRRTALGLGVMAALDPSTLTSILRESAAEAVEFTRGRGTSAVGAGTLDHLTTVVAGLDRSYPWQPATDLFPVARAYRQYVEQLIDGRHTLAEARELYVHGAYLSHILSDLAYDLGSTVTARAYAVDSYQLAEQAGHDELCAWAADTLASVLVQTGRPGEAASTALKGLRRAPRRHPLAARLYARAAQDHARQVNREACVDLLTKARAVCDRLPAEMPSRFSTDNAEHTAHSISTYTARCHIELGDWKEATRHARTALGVAKWSPGRAAYAHLDLGTALANLGSPDEAAEHGMQAFALRHDYGTLLQRARELDTALMSRYPKEPCALDFNDHYQQLASRALAN
jgi:tetratricopeptide (TPR) repeat protein